MEKIENNKNMIVLRPVGNIKSFGYTAVFMDLTQPNSRINIIGNRQNSSLSLFITSKTQTGTKYTRLGQADKKSYIFDKSKIAGTITGAVIGRADSKGALSIRYLEGSIKSTEAPKNIYVKGMSNDIAPKNTMDKNQQSVSEKTEKHETVNPDTAKLDTAKKEETKDMKNVKEKIPENVAKNKNIQKTDNEKSDNKKAEISQKSVKSEVSSSQKTNYKPDEDEVKTEDTFKKIINDFSSQMKKLESLGVINSNEAAEIENGKPSGEKSSVPNMNEKIYPFDNSSFNWIKGTIDDLWILGCDAEKLYRPLVLCSECKNGYIIIGCPSDKSCVVVGIPCNYCEKDSKEARDEGFVDFWKSNADAKHKTSENFGYWIMNM